MDENDSVNTQTENQGSQTGGKVVEQGAQQLSKKLQKEATKNAHKMALKGALSHIMMYVFAGIVIFIIVVGIIMFLVTMPGMVMEKLKALFKAVGNYVAAFFGADTTEQIDAIQVYETLDYLEDMGYDLKGEGFLSDYETIDDLERLTEEDKDAGYTLDKKQGVIRDGDGNIAEAKTDFIYTYIMSDNYIYTLKNDNLVTQDKDASGFFGKLGNLASAVSTAWYKIRNFTIGPIYDALGITDAAVDAWGKGMLVIYTEEGGIIGGRGNVDNSGTLWDWDTIKIDTDSKKLVVKRRSIFNNNNAMEFSLDGWSGRYGMPVEFLLSVHKATGMPDLAVDMVNSFPTQVEIILHETSGEALGGYKIGENRYVAWPEISEAITGLKGKNWLSKFWANFVEWIESDNAKVEAARSIGIDVGLTDCGCTFKKGNGDRDGYPIYKDGKKWKYQNEISYHDEDGNKVVIHEKDEEYEVEDEDEDVRDIDIVETACERCRGIVNGIWKYLGGENDYHFDAYTPYISRVTKHWYRDVYFVINPDIEDVSDKKFVQYDYDYEAVMKERWTLYETYTDNPADGYKYNEDKEGEFILFVVDEDGSFLKDEDGNYVLFDGNIEDARPSVLYEKNAKGEYVEYTGNYNNTDGKILYRKNSRYTPNSKTEKEYVEYTGTVAVTKKAVELEINEDNLEDLGWNNSHDIWSAYEREDTSSGFEPLFLEEEIAEESNKYYQDAMRNSYINVNLNGNVVQTGEGLRTETNYKIKKMFLQNNYFKYDGSTDTADIITKLRNKVYEERKNDSDKNNNIKYGPLTDAERELYISETSSTDADGDGKNDVTKYYVKDYSGKVVLNQDSLNAFSMLENTHTLDADYIYRDFKELIVELGYFEKEELTDETPRLLQFLVPEIGSGGFPRRVLDKRENEKGTMLHSEYDYEANKKYTMQFLLENIDKLTEPPEGAGQEQETIAGIDGKEFRNDILGTLATTSARPMTRFTNIGSIQEIPECNYEVSAATGATGRGVKVADLEVDGVGYEIWRQTDSTCTLYSFAFMATAYTGEPFKDYVTTSSGSFINATGTGQGGNSFWQQGAGVIWSPIQEEIGGEYYFPSDPDIGGKVATALSEGKPVYFYGDYKASGGYHAVVLLGNSDNGVLIYDPGGGNVHVYNSGSSFSSSLQSLLSTHFKHRILIPDEAPEGVKKTGESFTGYKGNEAVVSPVTGILLEYGTYTNDDIDVEAFIKGETEKLNKEETTNENVTDETTEEKEKVTKEPDRINVDLKYGPKVSLDMLSDEEETTDGSENTDTTDTNTTGNETTDEVKGDRRIVVDEVGYARILVLDKESYEKLEKNTNTKWKTYDDSDGLLSDKGVYADAIFSEEDLEEQKNKEEEAKRSAELMETVYGYKEFAERYEMAGISGYIIQIDGFKPELPDESFTISEDPTAQTEKPKGTALTMDSFKIQPSKITEENENIISLYEPDEDYKMASERATNKLNVENLIKTNAAPALTADGLIFIKEGTVIGRTYTDREVIEDLRSEEIADYKGETKDSTTTSTEGLDPDNDKLVGNYLRITMTDLDKNIVEDVENYMKLDEETMGDVVDFSILGTVLSREEWVEMAYEYASNHGADSTFTNKDNLGKMYDICVENGVNPEYIFVRGIQESGLSASNGNNYWGYNTPNGADLWDGGTWENVLTLYCGTINEYQDPSTWQYDEIMKRYEERKNCAENGGIDPLGFGKPDTIGGQMCLYSWLGDDHSANTAGGGGMYYLYPWGWGGNQYEGENKIIFESKQEFEQLCGSKHNTSGGKTSNVATTVWEQGMYTAYQSRIIVDMAKNIFGERAGTYR